MGKFVTDKKLLLINIILRLLPLNVLFPLWAGIPGVKQYAGIVYFLRNLTSSTLFLFIIFAIVFIKINWKYKIIINVLANIAFWTPLFYCASQETNSLRYLTSAYYIGIFVVCIFIALQTYTTYKYKG